MTRRLMDSNAAESHTSFLINGSLRARNRLPPQAVTEILRRRRSQAYVAALAGLDAGSHHCSRDVIDELMRQIESELPALTPEDHLIGVLAKCHLGSPFEVHSLDRTGSIITHYKTHERLPPLFERGRSLALHPAYAFVEIYVDKLVPIQATGHASIF